MALFDGDVADADERDNAAFVARLERLAKRPRVEG